MSKKYEAELLELFCNIADKITMSEVFSNMFTPQEREELAIRLQIFNELMDNKNQRYIARKLGVSIATVTRGSRELKYGKPGIRKVIDK